MAVEKRCSRATVHKPHLWSRTTRKTVTEETTGDTLQCPGMARPGVRAGEEARAAQIAADARSGTNWASQHTYGPACVCGAFLTGSMITSWGRPVLKGICHRHGVARGSRIAEKRD